MFETNSGVPSRLNDPRRDEMKTPDDVSAMARLKGLLESVEHEAGMGSP